MSTPMTSTMDRMELTSLTRFIPFSMPRYTLTPAKTPIPMMTTMRMRLPLPNPKVCTKPEESCMAANAKEVDSPKTVARMAMISTASPIGRRVFSGNIPTTASRKVIGALRLWKESAKHRATTQ